MRTHRGNLNTCRYKNRAYASLRSPHQRKSGSLQCRMLFLLISPVLLSGCSANDEALPERWFSATQVEQGANIFASNCAVCHGERAQSTPDWKKVDSNGAYPAPPLDGSAHAWHHDLSVLKKTIAHGGIPLGGTMPAFADKLSEDQQVAVIAYFQNLWPDHIYRKWAERFFNQ